RDGALFLLGPDGGDERLLTDAVPVSWPAWSPDKSRIAFVSLAMDSLSGNAKLYTIDTNGENLTELAQWVSPYSAPAWSPDGANLAYTSLAAFDGARERGTISIHLLDIASGRIEDLTGDLVSHAISPTWSPRGDRLAFISQVTRNIPGDGLLHQESSLHLLTLVTGETRQIANPRLGDAVRVSWSPAGDWLLIYGEYQGAWYETNSTSLHLLDVTTGALTDLNPAERQVSRPVWSPEGERFAYLEGQTAILIRTLELDQRSYNVISPAAGYLTWAPDGGALFVAAADSTSASRLIALDGSAPSQTALDLQYDLSAQYGGPPQWSPPHRFAPPSPPTVSGTAFDLEGDGT
nr:hypothetical protein [Chloroflexota bacterium]